MCSRLLFLLLLLHLIAAHPAQLPGGQNPAAPGASSEPPSVSGYLPTPLSVVDKMLEAARVQSGERVYDLGSGDGRIVIRAAQKFGAVGVGIELEPGMCNLARARINEAGLDKQVVIIEGSFFDQDLSKAAVVTVFLDARAMPRIKPLVEKYLHHGMRVVVLDSEIPGWRPTTVSDARDTATNRLYRIFLYEVSRPGDWSSFGSFGQPQPRESGKSKVETPGGNEPQ
jgi:SAM-dependent methyltransferase